MNKLIVFTLVCNTVFLVYATEQLQGIPSKKIGIFSDINQRKKYEDRFSYAKLKGGELDGSELYAVYDGHFCHRLNKDDDNDGSLVAQFLAEQFPAYLSKTSGTIKERMISACKSIDNDDFMKEHKDCGATAAIVLIKKDNNKNVAYCAHVGDPRIVIEKNGKVDFVTNDHVPRRADEHVRIEDAHGIIFNERVNGFLSVSRAFGDYALDSEKKLIIVEPDYAEIELTSEHKFLVLATNGLWRMVSSEKVVSVLNAKRENINDMKLLAKMLGMFAKKRNSQDNITIMLIDLLS